MVDTARGTCLALFPFTHRFNTERSIDEPLRTYAIIGDFAGDFACSFTVL